VVQPKRMVPIRFDQLPHQINNMVVVIHEMPGNLAF